MLVLTRKSQERIRIGDNITISILKVKGNAVSLGIEAPRSVRVVRGELAALSGEPSSEQAERNGRDRTDNSNGDDPYGIAAEEGTAREGTAKEGTAKEGTAKEGTAKGSTAEGQGCGEDERPRPTLRAYVQQRSHAQHSHAQHSHAQHSHAQRSHAQRSHAQRSHAQSSHSPAGQASETVRLANAT